MYYKIIYLVAHEKNIKEIYKRGRTKVINRQLVRPFVPLYSGLNAFIRTP